MTRTPWTFRTLLQMAAAFALLASFGTTLPNATAWAQELETQCTPDNDAIPRIVACDFRVTEPVLAESVEMLANGETLGAAVFRSFAAAERTSAWLYLIDTSNPARERTVRANVDFVKGQMALAGERRKIGVATFASNLSSVLPIASVHSNRDARLDAIAADGAATEFYSNTLEAIRLLGATEADRKVLVLMSDGDAEDTAYSLEETAAAANEAGVTIIGLGYAEREGQTPLLQPVEKLAQATGGTYREVVAAAPLPDAFVDGLTRTIENGGTVTAPVPDANGDTEIQLAVALQNGRTLRATQQVNLEEVPVEPAPAEPEDTWLTNLYGTIGMADWARANTGLAYVGLAVPLIVLALLAFALMRGRGQEEETATTNGTGLPEDEPGGPAPVDPTSIDDDKIFEGLTPATGVITEEPGVTRVVQGGGAGAGEPGRYGYFEVVGSEETKFPVNIQATSIGRHSDNDIQLANDSVHRHHAHLKVTGEGVVTIHDLDTSNGVLVNGKRVDRVQLASGDMIELGEVRLRYLV
ncbi:MAG: FHA domain-containing protein [Pseudomonadota bacterium]